MVHLLFFSVKDHKEGKMCDYESKEERGKRRAYLQEVVERGEVSHLGVYLGNGSHMRPAHITEEEEEFLEEQR